MKKISIIVLMFGLLSVGCSKQDLQENQEQTPQQESVVVENPIQFVAKADESGETKTVLDGTSVNWNGTESVTIFGTKKDESTVTSGVYCVSGTGASANLTYSSGTQFAQEDSPTYAVYPSGTSTDGTNITFTLPATQIYAENSFADGANVSVGAVTKGSDDKYTITFKNVCSYLNLKLSVGEGQSAYVGKIVLTSKDDVKISGECTVDASTSEPTAACSTGSSAYNTITLDCSSYNDNKGVELTTTATSFYFVVPATTFGFTAEVYSTQGHLITTLSSSSDKKFARKTAKNIAVPALTWLPSDYTEAEYLQGAGGTYDSNTTYIDTGIPYGVGWDYEVKCEFGNTDDQAIFGARTPGYRVFFIVYSSQFDVGIGADNYPAISPKIKTLYTYRLITNVAGSVISWDTYLNGSSLLTGDTNDSGYPVTNMWLFNNSAMNGGSQYPNSEDLKIYEYKVWNAEDKLIQHFIPAYSNDSNKPGMYNVAADMSDVTKFFVNQGATTKEFGYNIVGGSYVSPVYD